MKVSMKKIREFNPCKKSWTILKKAVSGDDVELGFILDLLGLEDAIWVLRVLEDQNHLIKNFGIDCIESVMHLSEQKDNRISEALMEMRKSNPDMLRIAESVKKAYSESKQYSVAKSIAAATFYLVKSDKDSSDTLWTAHHSLVAVGRAAIGRYTAKKQVEKEKEKQASFYRKYFCN